MATPTFVLFAAGLVVAVALIGYLVLVVVDNRHAKVAYTAAEQQSASGVEHTRPASM